MNYHSRAARLTARTFFVSAALLLGACSGTPRYSAIEPARSASNSSPSSKRHYDRNGEVVVLRLIPYSERESLEERLKISIPPQPDAIPVNDRSLFGAGELAAELVGLAVDAIKTELEKEAKRHVQQYTRTLYADGYWQDAGVPRYLGFELIRTTDAFPAENPASRLVCLFNHSQYDRRLVLLRPVYFKLNSAAAKVSPSGRKGRRLTVEFNAVMNTAIINKDGVLTPRQLADVNLKIPGYSLEDSKALTANFSTTTDADGVETSTWTGELAGWIAGYFLAPPIQFGGGASGWFTLNQGGLIKLEVAVTETDDSRARTNILEFAEFVGSQKERLQAAAREAATASSGTPGGPGGSK